MRKTIKIILLLCFAIFFGKMVQAQNVNIPDAKFKAVLLVKSSINTNGDNEIQISEAEGFTGAIDVNNKSITDLTGIEYFVNLKTLYCYENQLTNLDVSKNTALTGLYCSDNQITNLNVTGCENLNELYCGNNQLTHLNVNNNRKLTTLSCHNNLLSDLDIRNNTSLNVFGCNDNFLKSLKVSKNIQTANYKNNKFPFSELIKIKNTFLSLDYSTDKKIFEEIDDFLFEKKDYSAEYNISDNTTDFVWYNNEGDLVDETHIETVGNGEFKFLKAGTYYCKMKNSTFGGLELQTENITVIDDYIINIPDINFKAALVANSSINTNEDAEIQANEATKYTGEINLSNKDIADLTGIECFPNITILDCRSNKLISLDISKNKALRILYCFENQLTDLDVTNNTKLEKLDCSSNQLTTINLINNNSLTGIWCYNNQINNLNLSYNTILNGLFCQQNELNTLDVSNNTELEFIYCDENELLNLDVSKNIELKKFKCHKNKLTNLDITKNTKLTEFWCQENQLTDLDLSKNTELQISYCSSNLLKTLDISNNTKLVRFGCNLNVLESLITGENTNLIYLSSHSNNLTSIDLSKNTELTTFSCHNNQMTSLDISKNTKLNVLYCYNNKFPFSELIKIKNNFSSLDYYTNRKIFEKAERIVTNQIDYSTEYSISENITAFIWYNSAGNFVDETFVKPVEGENGKFKFLKAGTYYCKMANSAFNGLGLRTENITVSDDYIINIPDANFKAALVANSSINTNEDTEIQASEAEAYIETLNVSAKNIANLTGIEAFKNITRLICSTNKLKALDLSKNTSLQYLFCSKNSLTSINLGNSDLKIISCEENNLTDINVSGLSNLIELGCTENKITNLDVSKNTELLNLKLRYCNLKNLDVTNNLNLTVLDCYHNQIKTLDLSNNLKLTKLSCSYNDISILNTSNNIKLTLIGCTGNSLTSLDVTKNTKLKRLSCGDNSLTTLDVTKNTVLEELYFSNAEVANIDLSNNTELKYFSCANNKITKLDLSKNVKMQSLYCYSNQITDLNILNCTILSTIFCQNNKLKSINLSSQLMLKRLDCINNELTDLDISKCVKLEGLEFDENQLSNLDVTNNTELKWISCENNKFPLSELLKIKNKVSTLKYTSNKKIFKEINETIFSKIDYSAEYSISGNTTVFTWYNSSGFVVDETCVKPIEGENGKFEFLKAGTYHCKMTNSTFADAVLQTENITVSKANQTITFAEPTTATIGEEITLNATASSELDVTYSIISGDATLNGNKVTFNAEGNVEINATQIGNERYNSTEKSITVSVSKKSQTITFAEPTTAKVGEEIILNATASSELDVTYSIISGDATLNGNKVTFNAEGNVEINATQIGNETYNATEKSITVSVSKKVQTITFSEPTTAKVGEEITLNATASSELDVTYSIISGDATLNGNKVTFNAEGNVEINATQIGNERYNSTEKSITVSVSKKSQTITFAEPTTAKVGEEIILNATASSELDVTYSIISGDATLNGNKVTFNAEGNVEINATQIGNETYNATEKSITVVVTDNSSIKSFTEANISVYPNPVSHELTFKSENKIDKIILTDITGRIILEKSNISKVEQINMATLKSGIYLLKIQKDNKIYTEKIIKK